MSVFYSLESTSILGPGDDRQLLTPTAHHTMIVTFTGECSSCTVVLEGSHDGNTWAPLGNVQTGGESRRGIVTTQPTTHLVTWVRANLKAVQEPDGFEVTASVASMDGA